MAKWLACDLVNRRSVGYVVCRNEDDSGKFWQNNLKSGKHLVAETLTPEEDIRI